MNRSPIIAVSQRVDRVAGRDECRDALDQSLIAWVVRLGGLPLPVPNMLGDCLPGWLEAMSPSAVLLSGGNDIGEIPDRDRTEATLLKYAARTDLPVLGICRGMQMLVHYAGGTLVPVIGHAGTRHVLQGDLVAAGELAAEVDSFHDWGVNVCPPEYNILATAADGLIELIRHNTFRWEGWMWHPEREVFSDWEISRARALLIGR